jgi:hypothetical protein
LTPHHSFGLSTDNKSSVRLVPEGLEKRQAESQLLLTISMLKQVRKPAPSSTRPYSLLQLLAGTPDRKHCVGFSKAAGSRASHL